MSKMSELDAALIELSAHAKATLAAVQSIRELLSTQESEKTDSLPATKPITKEQVRTILAAKTAEGYGTQVRALLRKYGATQLSAVKPAEYSDLMLEAQAIGNEVSAYG